VINPRRVVSTRVPYIPITVEIPERQYTAEFDALVDTGFNAEVVIPTGAVSDGAPPLFQADVRLADGSRVSLPSYLGAVRIGDTAISPVLVMVMGDEAVIGLQVITRFHLTIDHDRTLTVEP